MNGRADALDYEAHRAFFREALESIHAIMAEQYAVRDVAISPLGSEGSRLSIPIKIEGVDATGEHVAFFAKILGNSELVTARTIQLFKNIFLRISEKESMFDTNASAEQLARHQFTLLGQIYELGIPTAKPLGYHRLNGDLWILVEEFLDAKAFCQMATISEDNLDTAFSYLERMHKAGIYHGDIKPENIMFSDQVYIIDVGNFLDTAPKEEMAAYDLASIIASFLDCAPPETVVDLALKHFSKKHL
jgi:tRNA A-37 threonylcarbamoyl transferase component Bud32